MPEKFHELQWTRLPAGETPPEFVERIRRLLSNETSTTRAAPSTAPSGFTAIETFRKSVPPPCRSTVLWAIGVLLAVALAYFAVNKLLITKNVVQPDLVAQSSKQARSAPIAEKSIAVLPFVDMSEKHDQEYFGDGMAEEIMNSLVNVPDLKVIGRTSSFQFKGKTDDLRKVGTVLGTAYVVEGSVRRSGDHIRVTAQLIDTRDGAHRWSQTYDRDASDTLKVQEEIAMSLVRALQLEVTTVGQLQGRALL